MLKPYSPSTWSHLRGFQEWPNVPSLIGLGGKNPSHTWEGTNGCSEALGSPGNIFEFYFLQLLPLARQGMRTANSALLLRCSSRRHSLALATILHLKRPDSFRNPQGWVLLLTSRGAGVCFPKAESVFPSKRWVFKVALPGAGLAAEKPPPASCSHWSFSLSLLQVILLSPQATPCASSLAGHGGGDAPFYPTREHCGCCVARWWHCDMGVTGPPPAEPCPPPCLCSGGPGTCPCPWWPRHWARLLGSPDVLLAKANRPCVVTLLSGHSRKQPHGPQTTPISSQVVQNPALFLRNMYLNT